MPWAAAARLRVACFLVGFFETTVQYMKLNEYANIDAWRANFLQSNPSVLRINRHKFWYEVVEKALTLLRANDFDKLKKWWNQPDDDPTITNVDIHNDLQQLLKKPIRAFFTSEIIKEFISECRTPPPDGFSDLPFLFIIDEAAFLYQTNYMHSFMWVLDQPVTHVLYELRDTAPAASRFFVLMLGTHSQISHFTPRYQFPSERYFEEEQHITSVFLSLDWNSGVKAMVDRPTFEESAHISKLVRWGRPLWMSFYNGLQIGAVNSLPNNKRDASDLRRCVMFAFQKLVAGSHKMNIGAELIGAQAMTVFAILAIRLHLDLDVAFPSRASKLISSKMRWLVDVDDRREHLTSTYGSEPLLAEAAAYAMNSYEVFRTKGDNPLTGFLGELKTQLTLVHVNRGENGELTARLLCTNPDISNFLIFSAYGKGPSYSRAMVERHTFSCHVKRP
jgi:hypothetical protein